MAGDLGKLLKKIEEATADKIKELIAIWSTMFSEKDINKHLHKLDQELTKLFEQLKKESLDRQKDISFELQNSIKIMKTKATILNENVEDFDNDKRPLLVIYSEVESKIDDLNRAIAEKQAKLCRLINEEADLCSQLDEVQMPFIYEILPSDEQMQAFDENLCRLRRMKTERIELISDLRTEIKGLLAFLEREPSEEEDHLIDSANRNLDANTIRDLQSIRDRLLKTFPFNEYSLHKYRTTDQKLEVLKDIKMQHLNRIEILRKETNELRKKTFKDRKGTGRADTCNTTTFTKDLLALHELELKELRADYEKNKPIYDLYAKFESYCTRMSASETELNNNQQRFRNRKSTLLTEERQRKNIELRSVQVQKELEKLVSDYEHRERKPFLINGVNIRNVMGKQAKNQKVQPSPRFSMYRTTNTGNKENGSEAKK